MHHLVHEDVVISGIGGYFPQSLNISQFKDHLLKNHNLVQQGRWKAGQRGVTNLIGKIPSIEFFDNSFFGIHQQQSQFMDPTHRLALERSYEALLDAGVNIHELSGKNIGCYLAASLGENDKVFLETATSSFVITGHTRAMLANRISFWLDIKGPSVAYDSNWIGGMEVIREAYNAIKSGKCESALIGTSNLILSPEIQWYFNDMGLLSQDGSTRSFDVNADGYARSDGVVMMYLQKASEARRSYATIENVMTRFDGTPNSIFLDIGVDNMVEFIEDFYKVTKVDPKDVEFVEAYGCAVKETDKKELEALEKVYCKNRANPLLVGSVKTNTGHSEASSVLFGIAKVLIAMDTGTIPANIQFGSLNTEIGPLARGTIEVVTENRQWGVTYAAVNALGINSYYGHLLLRANPKKKQVALKDQIPRLVVASTRTESGINEILKTLQSKVDPEYIRLVHDVYSQPIQRHVYRGYTLLGSNEKIAAFEPYSETKRPIWYVYSGMGSQWVGMTTDMMKVPVFAQTIHKCHKVLEPVGLNLIEIMSTTNPKIFDVVTNAFVGITAFQIALTDVLTAMGIKPDGFIGHSAGELACTYADNCYTAEEVMLMAYYRGVASLEVDLINGRMAAVGLGYQQIKDDLPPTIDVACRNSADSCTISGPAEDVENYTKNLSARGIFVRIVNSANIAFHSRYIESIAVALDKYLKGLMPEKKLKSSRWISTSIEEINWDQEFDEHITYEYVIQNVRAPVYFEEGLKHIPKDSIIIEIGPQGLLQTILKKALTSCTNVSLTQRGTKSGVDYLLSSLGKLYLAGLDPDVSKLYPQIEYPVSRGTDSLADLAHWDHSESWRSGAEESQSGFGVRDVVINLNCEEFRDCSGHQMHDKIVLACSTYLSLLTEMNMTTHKEIVFENLEFKRPLVLSRAGSIDLQLMIQKGSSKFEILSENDLIVTGSVYCPDDNEQEELVPMFRTTNVSSSVISSDLYSEFQDRGHKYSGHYKSIKSIDLFDEGSVARVKCHNWRMLFEALIQQYLLLEGEKNQDVVFLKHIDRIVLNQHEMEARNCEVETFYEYSSGWLFTRGVQIEGIVSEPLKCSRTISYDSLELTAFRGDLSKMDEMINVAFQLTLQNFVDSQGLASINIFEVESKNQSLLTSVKNVLKQYNKVTPNFVAIKHFDKTSITIDKSSPLFILANDVASDDLVQLVSDSHAFLLSRDGPNLLKNPNIAQVCEFRFSGVNYSITKQANNSSKIVVASSDKLSASDLTNKSKPSWVVDLEAALGKFPRILLVCHSVPTEGILNFASELLKSPKFFKAVNIFFNLGGAANEGVIQQVTKLNLKICVQQSGQLGGILPVPVSLKDPMDVKRSKVTSKGLMVQNTSVRYLGLNLKDEIVTTDQSEVQLGNIDYSGIQKRRNVMGIGCLDKVLCEIVPDSVLFWNVPQNWTLEDAATVPHAYISAFYCLFEKAKLKPDDKVLIHSGCTPIGFAAISLALKHGCRVFTTVETEVQRSSLRREFNNLSDRNILNLSTFETLLVEKVKTGVDVIIHNLPVNRLTSSIRSLSNCGRLVQIATTNTVDLESLTASKSKSFYKVSLDDIFGAPDEVKNNIQQMMMSGIKDSSVKPINRSILCDEDINISESLKAMQCSDHIGKVLIKANISMNQFILDNPTRLICDRKSSFLIFGGSVSNCLGTLKWLVLRGAQKVTIASDFVTKLESNRRIQLLNSYFGVNVSLMRLKCDKLNSNAREAIIELVSDTQAKGPIQAVFVLPSAVTSHKLLTSVVKYLDQALRSASPKAIMVNFVGTTVGIIQSRLNSGQDALNIQWEDGLGFDDILYGLDESLTFKLRNIRIKNNNVVDKEHQETPQALIKKLSLLLPSCEELVKQSEDAPAEPDLVQLPTLGPLQIRELAPVFILPGLSGQKECREMAFELLYPTFCAVYPKTPISIKELAASLTKKIVHIWPKGAYNIIGISWGGSLMIEIARLLAKRNASLHLYFIDGAPDTLQSTVRCLGEDLTSFETNLLSRILGINDSKGLKSISSAKSWESRINIAFDYYGSEVLKEKKTQLGVALLKLRGHLEDLLAVKSNGVKDLIPGQIHLIRPQGASQYDNCGLVHYCKQMPQIVVMPGDHLSIINCVGTPKYINENHRLK